MVGNNVSVGIEGVAELQTLNVEQVAAIFGVAKRTIWRLVAGGKISKPIKVSRGTVRWLLRDINHDVKRLADAR